jgi:hypothetical protein
VFVVSPAETVAASHETAIKAVVLSNDGIAGDVNVRENGWCGEVFFARRERKVDIGGANSR